MSKLPTTLEAFWPWFDDELKSAKPMLSEKARHTFLAALKDVIKSNYNMTTFVEGWEAGKAKAIDPQRMQDSLKSMRGEK